MSLADLAAQLEFSGHSSRTRHAASGQLTIGGSSLMPSNHDLALDFQDSVSHNDSGELRALGMRYAFPVAGGRVSVALNDADHNGVVRNANHRSDARREHRSLTLSGSRALWSWRGLELDGLFSHSSDTSRLYEESEWVADSTHRRSRVVIRCSGKRELPGGFVAGSTLAAMGGWDARESLSPEEVSASGARYHKLSLTASVHRGFYTWEFAVDGRYQFAPEDLAPSEYLRIAGPSLMRGFNGQSKAVSEGGWFRVNARSPGYSVPFTDAFNSFLSLSVLRGWSAQLDTGGDGFRASTGEIGLHLQGRGFHASLNAGRMLDLSGSAMRRPENPDVLLTLSMGI